ncbi:MAG: diguanylate cyclase [Actinomycetota bacterium]
MSFRGRLTLFFLLIVVLPMVAVAVLVTHVTSESESGKADARLAAGLDTALATYNDAAAAAERAAKRFASDPAAASALRSGDPARIEAVARRLAAQNGIRSLVIRDPSGDALATIGPGGAVATYELNLTDPSGSLGSLTASTITASDYLNRVSHLTGRDGALLDEGGVVSSTLALNGASLPSSGDSADVEVGGESLRARSADLPGAGNLRLALVGPVESGGFLSSRPLVVAALVVFFAVALIFVTMLLRMLGGQVRAMLEAARRIGEGDFSRKVPVLGDDEMAGLASEFNKMSDRLTAQMEELRRRQVEIDRSVRRIGEAFASGLDRQTVLEGVVDTALEACGAQYGTIAVSGGDGAEAHAGEASKSIRDLAAAAEADAQGEDDIVSSQTDGIYALASPLRQMSEPPINVGVMTVARRGEPFRPAEREVFLYLAGQVSAPLQNIARHELVSEQAVTDELTGLSNNRRFRELISKEADRAERFGHELSLIMLDIDDFKQINDTYGHPQGDKVLRMVGRVLHLESRGVDEPARYGGEEFAVALPETGLEGALDLAERVRVRIESEQVPRAGSASPVKVTASIGAASMSGSADGAEALIAAADAALYEAKRAGKNRVASAPVPRAAGRS